MKDSPSRSTRPRRWPRWIVQAVLGIGVASLAVAGVVAVGRVARESLGPQDRYLLPFVELECPSPADQDRRDFLGEVQYSGQFPDRVNVLDPTLPDRLRVAFSRHPKVAKVGKITVLPPRRIIVELTLTP